MKIAIIGTGNKDRLLANLWAHKGHRVFLGVVNKHRLKNSALSRLPNTSVHTITEAVQQAEVVLLATPAAVAVEATRRLGNTAGKVVIDATDIEMERGPEGFTSTNAAIMAHTATSHVARCFNCIGTRPNTGSSYLPMAGDSQPAKAVANRLAKDAGYLGCSDMGGSENFATMEQLGWNRRQLALTSYAQ